LGSAPKLFQNRLNAHVVDSRGKSFGGGEEMAYEQETINYLSKEIETHSNNQMVFRSRVNLSVFLGPFIILGYLLIGTKGFSFAWKRDPLSIIAIALVCFCFLAMGYITGRIEDSILGQCNKWRELIAGLQKPPAIGLEPKDLVYALGKRELTRGYMIVYSLQLLSLSCIVYLVLHVGVMPPAAKLAP
jgi:hypothetical protein